MARSNKEKSLVIGLLPYNLEANTYIQRNRRILGTLGDVHPVPAPLVLLKKALLNFFKIGRFKIYDILIVNWRENSLKNNKNKIQIYGIAEYYISLLLHRMTSNRLVYVKHNHTPHNLSYKDTLRAKRLLQFGLRFAHAVVVHSPDYVDGENTYYVPHPLYQLNFDPMHVNEEREKEFIMFGRVQPYKNIHDVIKHWRIEVPLVIMGPCEDKNYLKELESLSKGKKIEFEIGFHDESYLQKRVACCSAVIIANDKSSMLVSGSFFFAISCGTPVYALQSSFFEWIKETDLGFAVMTATTVDGLIEQILLHEKDSQLSREKLLLASDTLFGEEIIARKWNESIL